jgi:hemoglobin/transferrin/lactoferrin receptor protein
MEALVTVAASQDELSARDVADTQRIPPGGTPGYEVLTVRGGLKLRDALAVTAALENALDEDYRIHGSGVNEPGRNLVVGVAWTF